MNENLKKFLEEASKNEELKAKLAAWKRLSRSPRSMALR